MTAVIHVKPDEFDENFFKKIKSLLNSAQNIEITISINEKDDDEKLNKAIENVEANRNLTYFTMDEYEDFKKQILNEP